MFFQGTGGEGGLLCAKGPSSFKPCYHLLNDKEMYSEVGYPRGQYVGQPLSLFYLRDSAAFSTCPVPNQRNMRNLFSQGARN